MSELYYDEVVMMVIMMMTTRTTIVINDDENNIRYQLRAVLMIFCSVTVITGTPRIWVDSKLKSFDDMDKISDCDSVNNNDESINYNLVKCGPSEEKLSMPSTCSTDQVERPSSCSKDKNESISSCSSDRVDSNSTCSRDRAESTMSSTSSTCSSDRVGSPSPSSSDKEESNSPCSSVNVEHNSPCSSVNVEQNSPCSSVSVEQNSPCSSVNVEHNSPCSSDTVESNTTSARDRVESSSSCSSDRVDSVSDEPGSSDVTAEHSEAYISSDDSIQRGKLGPGTNSESAESTQCVPTEVDSSDPGRKKMPSPICSQSLEYEKPEFEDDSVHIETWYLDDEHVRHLESTASCSPVPDRTGDAVQQSAVNENINSSVASVMDSFSEFFAPALDLPVDLDIPASLDIPANLDHHVDLETSCNETWYETSDDHPNNDASSTVDVAKVGGNKHAAAEVRDAETGDAHGADDAISDLLNETSFFDALPLDAELEAPGSATVEPYSRDMVPSLKSEHLHH